MQPADPPPHVRHRVIRTSEVARRLGVSRTTLWRLRRTGDFPPPLRLGTATEHPLLGWLERDVDDWLASRPRVTSPPGENSRLASIDGSTDD